MPTVFADIPDRPLYMQAAGNQPAIEYTASDFRELVYATLPHQGRITPQALRVTPTNPVSWGVTIATGQYVIGPPGDQYVVTIRTPIDVPLTGYNTNPAAKRTHVVHLVVYDSGNMSSGDSYKASIIITEDTGGGAPVPTDGYVMPLAWVTIQAGQAFIQSTHITNYRDYTWHGLTARTDIFTLNSGVIDASGGVPGSSTPRAIYRNGYLTLFGALRRAGDPNSYWDMGSVFQVATINEPWRPNYRQQLLIATTSNIENAGNPVRADWLPDLYARLDVYPDGRMLLVTPFAAAPEIVFLDGTRIELT